MLGRTDRPKNTLRELLKRFDSQQTEENAKLLLLASAAALSQLDPDDHADQSLIVGVARLLQKP